MQQAGNGSERRAHANCFVHQNAMASLGRHGDRTGGCF